MNWIVMPVMAGPEMTQAAINDCLAQSIPTRLLIVNQGVDDDFRQLLEQISEEYPDRVFVWHHNPPLLSLAATWNRALDFVWDQGGYEALVINNDVRLHTKTMEILGLMREREKALFLTCVGVTADQFDPQAVYDDGHFFLENGQQKQKGGPDFSCYLIGKECHRQYRFDEAFIPAYCEDLDYHRRLMLGGDGAKIFSINLPYLHLAAQTLKVIDGKTRAGIEKSIATGSRTHYEKKWGGPVNQETYQVPFGTDGLTFTDGSKTTPALQAADRAAERGLVPPKPDPILGMSRIPLRKEDELLGLE